MNYRCRYPNYVFNIHYMSKLENLLNICIVYSDLIGKYKAIESTKTDGS